MKMNYNMFSLFGSISKFRAFTGAVKSVFALHKVVDMSVIHNENIFQEKLQIRYANLRV